NLIIVASPNSARRRHGPAAFRQNTGTKPGLVLLRNARGSATAAVSVTSPALGSSSYPPRCPEIATKPRNNPRSASPEIHLTECLLIVIATGKIIKKRKKGGSENPRPAIGLRHPGRTCGGWRHTTPGISAGRRTICRAIRNHGLHC